MAKWSGKIGFVTTAETPSGSGIWKEVVVVKNAKGDVKRSIKKWQVEDKVNDNITLNNEISIVGNPYIMQNYYAIRFISFMGAWWSVNTVTLDYPRLTLEIGGLYNGDTTATPVETPAATEQTPVTTGD